jgi:hypothetical protein
LRRVAVVAIVTAAVFAAVGSDHPRPAALIPLLFVAVWFVLRVVLRR